MPELTLPIEATAFVVVDVETTGLGQADRVIEIAAIRLERFQEVARFQSLVNPGITIAPAASAVSGITDEMVSRAPIFPEVAPEFERLIGDAVFVAHNAPFDLQFLSRERKRWDLAPWKGPVLDTLRLARNTVELPGYSLGALQEALQLEHAPAHRALADVLATVSLLHHLIERIDPRPRTLGELLKAQEPVPVPWEAARDKGLETSMLFRLRDAEQRGQIVELEYEGRAGIHAYWLRPVGAEHNGHLYYVRAELAEGDDVRVFRFDRIRGVRFPGNGNEDQHGTALD